MTTVTRTTYTVGSTRFTLPFSQESRYVVDANGVTVMECFSPAVAAHMMIMLNAAAK
jgi:hypothetical protein